MFRLLLIIFASALLTPGVAQAQTSTAGQIAAPAQASETARTTLEAIRAAEHMDCGVVTSADDWNSEDVHGNLSGLEIQICRAVAVAVLGDAGHVTIHAFPGEPEAVNALKAGAIQLAVGVSPSATSATQFGLGFGPPVFYDSTRVMVSTASGIKDLAGLRDKLICAIGMSAPQRTLHDELTAKGIRYGVMSHSEQGEMDAAVGVRHCEAAVAMETRLAQSRANFRAPASDFVFLPERFGLNPVVPAYRYGDQTFGLVVEFTVNALVEAEALGLTQANVLTAQRDDMRAELLLGHDFATAQALGLAHDWAARVIAATGNYGEIFQRTMGGPYHLERGLNALWTDGGLMRSQPMK